MRDWLWFHRRNESGERGKGERLQTHDFKASLPRWGRRWRVILECTLDSGAIVEALSSHISEIGFERTTADRE